MQQQFYQRFPWSYVLAGSAVALMTAVLGLLHADTNLVNVSMLYLLVIMSTALFAGSGPAVFAAIAALLSFDWFFVEPKYQFTVQDPTEWLALCVFLFTALVIGQLTATLNKRAEEAQLNRQETLALAQASWAIASELDLDRAIAKVLSNLVIISGVKAAGLIVQEKDGEHLIAQYPSEGNGNLKGFSTEATKHVLDTGLAINWEDNEHFRKTLAQTEDPTAIYLPISMDDHVLGVLYLLLEADQPIASDKRQVISSLANHAAVLLQKDKYLKAEAAAQALAEADRLKTALLSMVSHDFRSPLTSIKASVSSLSQEGSPWDIDSQRSLLQTIDQETDRLNRMVGNILDLSRLEAGAWRPRCEPTSMAELFGATLDTFSTAENKRIVVEIEGNCGDVYLDIVQMVQVLRNLLENALKYSLPDTTIELKAHTENNSVVTEVLDRGPGLPRGEENRIFEPFYRAAIHHESSTPGVGIGLAICQGLVQAHGGNLTAYNRDGGGALLRVILPLTPPEQVNNVVGKLTS